MRHKPHGIDGVTDVSETAPQYVFVVIPPLPFFRGNAQNFRNGFIAS